MGSLSNRVTRQRYFWPVCQDQGCLRGGTKPPHDGPSRVRPARVSRAVRNGRNEATGIASPTLHPLARFIKDVKLRLFHRYIESDILCHGDRSLRMLVLQQPSSIRVRANSFFIGSRDYLHVSQFGWL